MGQRDQHSSSSWNIDIKKTTVYFVYMSLSKKLYSMKQAHPAKQATSVILETVEEQQSRLTTVDIANFSK